MLMGLAWAAAALAQQGDGTDVPLSSHVWKPDKVPADDAHIAQLKVPAGFAVNVFARNLKNARILAVAPNGNVYVSRRDQGDVLLLTDTNSDGKADGAPRAVVHRSGAHGIAIHDNTFYLVTVKELFSGPLNSDGTVGPLKLLAGDDGLRARRDAVPQRGIDL